MKNSTILYRLVECSFKFSVRFFMLISDNMIEHKLKIYINNYFLMLKMCLSIVLFNHSFIYILPYTIYFATDLLDCFDLLDLLRLLR